MPLAWAGLTFLNKQPGYTGGVDLLPLLSPAGGSTCSLINGIKLLC